uniref:Serine/threonine-protein phosphatase n=1 Tax=Caenorhabditis tropicalis TaxID=1561998 RepID=A0A1I7UF77_9PELO
MSTLGPSTSSSSSTPNEESLTEIMLPVSEEAESPISRESYPIWKAMQPDDLFDLSMCSDESKKQVPSLQFGVTRLEFNDGQFRVFVANRSFDTDETKIEVAMNESYFSSKIRRITNYFRSRKWPMIRNRTINGVTYEIINFRKEFIVYTHDISSTFKDLLNHLFFVFPNSTRLFSLDLRGIRTENFDIPRDLLDNYEQCLRCQCVSIKILTEEFVEQAHRILEKMQDLKNLKLDLAKELNDANLYKISEADEIGFKLSDLIKRLLKVGQAKAVVLKHTEIHILLNRALKYYMCPPDRKPGTTVPPPPSASATTSMTPPKSPAIPLLELQAPMNICGDTHGQYNDLLRIFNSCGAPTKSQYLFLGDYIDRGRHSLEVIVLLFALKLAVPRKVHLLRGNHELKAINKNYGFYAELKARFRFMSADTADGLYTHFNQVFSYMPLAAVVSKRILCMHGDTSDSPKIPD